MKRLLAILLLATVPAHAQLVAGPWVDRAQARIDAARKTEVEVLVLDAQDRPVRGATVRITQRKHAFPFGVVLPVDHPHLLGNIGDPDRSVWRGLSAVSLADFSAWPVLQPDGPTVEPAAMERLDGLLEGARARGLRVRLGAVAPGDAADRPAWAVGLGPGLRLASASGFLDALAERTAGRVHAFELVSSAAGFPWLTTAETRRLGQRARAAWAPADAGGVGPPVWLGLGVAGTLDPDHGGAVLPAADALRNAFVPVDGVSTELRLRQPVEPEDLERSLQRLETFDLDAAVDRLEVGGDEVDQPFELEAALTLLFAEPRVREIQLGGVEPGHPASLFDAAGNPTPGGAGVDFLIADRWWTRDSGETDTLGLSRFRVFAGIHLVEVELPDGPTGSVEVAVPLSADPARVVVGAVAAPLE